MRTTSSVIAHDHQSNRARWEAETDERVSGSSEDEIPTKRRRTFYETPDKSGEHKPFLIDSPTMFINGQHQLLEVVHSSYPAIPPTQYQAKILSLDQPAGLGTKKGNGVLMYLEDIQQVSTTTTKSAMSKNGCTNCHTEKSPIWRKGPSNSKLCNKCGLYWKRYSKQRPMVLQKQTEENSPKERSDNLLMLIAAIQKMQET
ncbi:nitrogen regulatory protein [Acrasis kona]|uniref:Nitrogen regulatory protein n=1 Tax=Acrasis kona TaxID=1008807 RepID=A0AAW2ZCU6_9EUKA